MKLKKSFFEDCDTVSIAKNLLWKKLIHRVWDIVYSWIINETEAYTADDPASHSHLGKVSQRNWSMFESPGHVYVYKIYGIYHCINFATEKKWYGAWVLVRSVIPIDWIEQMKHNRGKTDEKWLVDGPGKLCIAFEFDRSLNWLYLYDESCPIEIHDVWYKVSHYVATSRIGISKWTDLLWRFVFTR